MAFEIESKFRLTQPVAFLAQAQARGILWGETSRQVDRYLRHPARDFATTGEAFRIRRAGEELFVTYKGPRQAHAVKTRREIELPLATAAERFEEYAELFAALGFEPVAEVAKTRRKAIAFDEAGALEVCFDEVDGLGTFVEIEALADEPQIAQAQRRVSRLAATFGLTDAEPRSYLRLLLERAGPTG